MGCRRNGGRAEREQRLAMTAQARTLPRRAAGIIAGALAAFLMLAGACAWAEEPAGGVRWQDLTAAQQEILERFESRWEQLPQARQRALARGAERWASLTPEQREKARERWRSLDPDERRKMRERFREFKSLPPEQQARIREHFERFQSLPPEKRRELKEKFRNLPPEERRKLREKILAGEKDPADDGEAEGSQPDPLSRGRGNLNQDTRE